jgi:hypothetical protein
MAKAGAVGEIGSSQTRTIDLLAESREASPRTVGAVMASDIPDTFGSPTAMARALVTYIACPHEVRRRVLDNFRSAPCIGAIKTLRAAHLRPPTPVEPFKPHDGYYPGDAADALAKTNTEFLMRLRAERTGELLPCA